MKKIYALLLFLTICYHSFSQWFSDAANGGTAICNATTNELNKLTVTDGSNGAIVVFISQNAGSSEYNTNIYAQRINSSGQLQWGSSSSPKAVSTTITGDKELQHILPDGSGGVYVFWLNYSAYDDSSALYLQHLNSSGNPLWAVNGIRINPASNREAYFGQLVGDGAGGVIITWTESVYDNTTNLTTYAQAFAQKYNSAGTAQWTNGGVQLCTAAGIRVGGSMIPDGSGGIIVSLTDTRNSNQLPDDTFDNLDIYAQRLNSNGTRMWTNNGVAVNTESFNQQTFFESISSIKSGISDGNGGMIFLFEDYTGNNDGNGNIVAQRINSNGVKQWATAGVPVCTIDSTKILAKILTDGAGGAVAFWNISNNGESVGGTYFAQRILANGTPDWTVNGVELFEHSYYTGENDVFDVTDNGAGNYTYVWYDATIGSLKAQKINNSGIEQWGADGKYVCTNTESYPQLGEVTNSDAGQLIINWIDNRNYQASNADIYGAKLTITGELIGSAASTTFTTKANGNWNDPSVWIGGVVPGATSVVIIQNNIIVTANAVCYSLSVQPPAGNITVNTGVDLTVLH